MHYLAVCCIARDEDHYLKEWLAYHALLGVEHFFIYDNCSKVLIRELLDDFCDGSRVTIRRIAGEKMQLPAYDDCLRSFGHSCKWIGFLDIDEFALPMRDNDLRVLLSEFEEYGGLGATWRLFGSSGHQTRPAGPVIKQYTEAFTVQESFQIKSFVQPVRTEQCLNPHYFRYVPGYFCVNEDHYPVSPGLQCTFSPGNRIRVNHYFLKSREDFAQKINRGGGAKGRSDTWHTMEIFDNALAKETVTETEITRFLPGLEKALRENRLPLPTPLLPKDMATRELLETALAFNEAAAHEKALACLCHGNQEHTASADFWTLRAIVALSANQPERAEIFIRQALVREPTEAAHKLLRTLLDTKGRADLVDGIHTILSRYGEFFS